MISMLTDTSLSWVRRGHGRRAGRMFCNTSVLCTHDAWPHVLGGRQGRCVSRGQRTVELMRSRTDVAQGGYNLDSISRSALAVTRTLMGEPPEKLVIEGASSVAAGDVELVMRRQSRYWSCLREDDIGQGEGFDANAPQVLMARQKPQSSVASECTVGMLARPPQPQTDAARYHSALPELRAIQESYDDRPANTTEQGVGVV